MALGPVMESIARQREGSVKVVKINVTENEDVRKNQTLAIVEAMKMENEIKSPLDGVVKKVYASSGDLVDSEKPLVEIEPKT